MLGQSDLSLVSVWSMLDQSGHVWSVWSQSGHVRSVWARLVMFGQSGPDWSQAGPDWLSDLHTGPPASLIVNRPAMLRNPLFDTFDYIYIDYENGCVLTPKESFPYNNIYTYVNRTDRRLSVMTGTGLTTSTRHNPQ